MSNHAATVKIVTVSNPKGDTEVHAPGCADLKRKAKGYQDAFTWEVSSAVELSAEFWADQISDTCEVDSPEGQALAAEWVGTFRFLPCAPAFPEAAEVAPLAVVSLDGEEIAVQVAATASAPHGFSAKGSAKSSACVHCGRTWAASAHRAFRAAA